MTISHLVNPQISFSFQGCDVHCPCSSVMIRTGRPMSRMDILSFERFFARSSSYYHYLNYYLPSHHYRYFLCSPTQGQLHSQGYLHCRYLMFYWRTSVKIAETICPTSSQTCDLRRVIYFRVILIYFCGVYPIERSVRCPLVGRAIVVIFSTHRKNFARVFPVTIIG